MNRPGEEEETEHVSLTGSLKRDHSDDDMANEYASENGVNRFNEDGSFIGEYASRNKGAREETV